MLGGSGVLFGIAWQMRVGESAARNTRGDGGSGVTSYFL